MNNPMTRRRFFQALACAAVAIGVPLPIGFPSVRTQRVVMRGRVRVRWMKLPSSGAYEMFFSHNNGPLTSFDPPQLTISDRLPPPGWTKLEPGTALSLYQPEPPPSWIVQT